MIYHTNLHELEPIRKLNANNFSIVMLVGDADTVADAVCMDERLLQSNEAFIGAGHRFSYRRIHIMLKCAGIIANHTKLIRLYREDKLFLSSQGGRKRALGTRVPMLLPLITNQSWSLDFVSELFTDCRRFGVLTVIDDCIRDCIALIAETSLSVRRVEPRSLFFHAAAGKAYNDGRMLAGDKIIRNIKMGSNLQAAAVKAHICFHGVVLFLYEFVTTFCAAGQQER